MDSNFVSICSLEYKIYKSYAVISATRWAMASLNGRTHLFKANAPMTPVLEVM